MCNRSDLLLREGLILLEFKEEFFKIEDKSEKKYIDSLAKRIDEKKNSAFYSKIPLWQIIFDETIERDKMYQEMCKEIRNFIESDFSKKLKIFLLDSNFLAMDMAQEIIYNIKRLDNPSKFCLFDEYDMEEWDNNKLVEFIEMGKRKYSVYENDAGEAELSYDFLKDLDSFLAKDKNNLDPLPVSFEIAYDSAEEENWIELEKDFPQLHILALANYKYKEIVLGKSKSTDISGILNNWVKKLDDVTDEDLRYIWEKMTHYNSIIIYAKIFSEVFSEKETDKEREMIIKEFSNNGLFSQTANMDNVLTKLLILNVVFTEIKAAKNQNDKYEILMQLRDFLLIYNNWYPKIKKKIMGRSMLVRWQLGESYQGYGKSKALWHDELSDAYKMEIFESWFLSSKIDDNWKYGVSKETNNKVIEFFAGRESSYNEYLLQVLCGSTSTEIAKFLEKISVLSIIDQDVDICKIVEELADMDLIYQVIIGDILINKDLIKDEKQYYEEKIYDVVETIRLSKEKHVMLERHNIDKLYKKNLQCLLKYYYQKVSISHLSTKKKDE